MLIIEKNDKKDVRPKRNFKKLKRLIIIIVILAVLGAAGYYLYSNYRHLVLSEVSETIYSEDSNTPVYQNLKKTSDKYYSIIYVTSNPDGARVKVDGDYMGTTPILIDDALLGEIDLQISKDGYKTYHEVLNFDELGEVYRISKDLFKSESKLVLISDPLEVSVSINGNYIGDTPIDTPLLDSGDYTLSAEKYGFFTEMKEINFKGGTIEKYYFKLKPKKEYLTEIKTQPDGASIIINNELVGETPMSVVLYEGDNSLLFRKSGYRNNNAVIQMSDESELSYSESLVPIINFETSFSKDNEKEIFKDPDGNYSKSLSNGKLMIVRTGSDSSGIEMEIPDFHDGIKNYKLGMKFNRRRISDKMVINFNEVSGQVLSVTMQESYIKMDLIKGEDRKNLLDWTEVSLASSSEFNSFNISQGESLLISLNNHRIFRNTGDIFLDGTMEINCSEINIDSLYFKEIE